MSKPAADPTAPPADPMDTLRGVSQPQRDLVRYLQGQFSKTLAPGGKVVVIKGANKR